MDIDASKSAKVTSLVKDWLSESLDVRRQAAAQLDKLGAYTAVINCVSLLNYWEEGSELDPQVMPSETLIKEILQRHIESAAAPIDRVAPLKQLKEVTVSKQASFLKKHILLDVGINDRAFRNYTGLYAFDGAHLIHLKGPQANNNLSEVLRSEALKLDQIEPILVTNLLTRSLLPLSRLGYSLRGHFVAAPSTDAEQESAVTKPTVQTTEEGGWNVHFWTQFWWGGCTAKTPLLFEHTVGISPDYEITFEPPEPDPVTE